MHIEQKNLIQKDLNFQITKLFEERMNTFEQLFKIYNSHTNLVSKNDEKNLFEKHIYDSLCFILFKNKYNINNNIKLMDIGTGGGFPSIPLSIAYPEMEICPVDSIAKKIGFIELVQKELRLDNLHPICKRVEELDRNFKGSFDVTTSRAVAPLKTLLEYAIPFVKKGGYFIAFKAKNADEEIEEAQNAIKVLKAQIIERIPYKLPNLEEYKRELLIIKKLDTTPVMYPRKSGQAKKNPL